MELRKSSLSGARCGDTAASPGAAIPRAVIWQGWRPAGPSWGGVRAHPVLGPGSRRRPQLHPAQDPVLVVEEEIQQLQALEAARAGGHGCGVAGSLPGPGPVVPPTATPWKSPTAAGQDVGAPGMAVPPLSFQQLEFPNPPVFHPEQPSQGVPCWKGWLIILGGKWRGEDCGHRPLQGGDSAPQCHPRDCWRPQTQREPLGQLTTCPTGQSTS